MECCQDELKIGYAMDDLDLKKHPLNYEYIQIFKDSMFKGQMENVKLEWWFKDYWENEKWDKVIRFFDLNCEIYAKVTKLTYSESDNICIVDLETLKFSKWYNDWKR